jgi:dolichol-phosphate mannosyltransferase
LIPAYNEEKSIKEVVSGAKKYADVCVIDDCSTDATPDILKRINGIHVIYHKRNTHIPGCLLDGMKHAVEKNYSYTISMDAGLSHNPDDIPKFMSEEQADLVIGCRRKKIDTPLFRRILSKIGNLIYNICLDFPAISLRRYYQDISSGYRKYSSRAMRLLLSRKMKSRSFDIMVESAHCINKNDLIISEVPITYRFTYSSLNLKTIFDCMAMCLRILFRS